MSHLLGDESGETGGYANGSSLSQVSYLCRRQGAPHADGCGDRSHRSSVGEHPLSVRNGWKFMGGGK